MQKLRRIEVNFSGKVVSLVVIFILSFLLTSSLEAFTYQPLVDGFPVVASNKDGSGDFAGYVNTIIKVIIGLIGVLAVLMIILGGIQYVSTDSWNDKDSGKKRIQAAVGGLLLALSSYLILNTIDPSLTYLNFASKLEEGEDLENKAGNLGTGGEAGPSQFYGPEDPSMYGNIVGPVNVGGYQGGATIVPTGSVPVNNTLTRNADGTYSIVPSRIALDTDGRTDPGIDQNRTADGRPQHQSRTSYMPNGQYMDATTDNYVVVPIGSKIPNGTRVTVTDHTTGKQVQAVVGDRGPGYGEISLHAAQELGAWTPGMGNAISQHNISFQFHTQ